MLTNVKSSLRAIKMLNAPIHLGPSPVPVMMDTKEMDGLVLVSYLYCNVGYITVHFDGLQV